MMKNFTRITALFMAGLMLVGLMPVQASAGDFSVSAEMIDEIYAIIEDYDPEIYRMIMFDPLEAEDPGAAVRGTYYPIGKVNVAAIGDSKAKSYADKLAKDLGASCTHLSAQLADGMLEKLTTDSKWRSKVAEAEIVTVNFNNTFAFDAVRAYMAGSLPRLDWQKLFGEDNAAKIAEALDGIRGYFAGMGLGSVMGLDIAQVMTILIECYVYDYVNAIVYMNDITRAIHGLNPCAEVVIVGLVNPFDGMTMEMEGSSIGLGEMFGMIVDAGSRYMTTVAVMNEKTTFIDASRAETGISGRTSVTMEDLTGILMGILMSNAQLPNDRGNAYIKDQILSGMSRAQAVLWHDGGSLRVESAVPGRLVTMLYEGDSGRFAGLEEAELGAGAHSIDITGRYEGYTARFTFVSGGYIPQGEYITVR